MHGLVSISIHQNRLVPTLEQMSDTTVPTIRCLRIDAVQLAHPFCKVPVRCLHYQVVVIPLLTICMANPVECLDNLSEDLQEL